MRKSIVAVILFLSAPLEAYFTRLRVMYHPELQQSVILCEDRHEATAYATEQRNMLIRLADCLNQDADGLLVLTEDMCTPRSDHPGTLAFIKQQQMAPNLNERILPGLTKTLRDRGVLCGNLEVRQMETASLYGGTVSAKEALSYVPQVLEELSVTTTLTPKNKQILLKYIERFYKKIQPTKGLLKRLRQSDKTVRQLLQDITHDEQIEKTLANIGLAETPEDDAQKPFFMFDHCSDDVIELLAFYEICAHPEKENIIVCAGVYHIIPLVGMLEEAGFEQVLDQEGTIAPDEFPPGFFKAVDLHEFLMAECFSYKEFCDSSRNVAGSRSSAQ